VRVRALAGPLHGAAAFLTGALLFQTLLLAGYLWAHLLVRLRPPLQLARLAWVIVLLELGQQRGLR
jgi:hypothetical protein